MKFAWPRIARFLVWAVVIVSAQTQPIIVRTETRLASGGPVASHLHWATIGPGAEISPPISVPGGGIAGAFAYSPDDEAVLAASRILPNLRDGRGDAERSYAVVCSPGAPDSGTPWMSPFGEDVLGAWFVPAAKGRTLATVTRTTGPSPQYNGTLHTASLDPSTGAVSEIDGVSVDFAGRPEVACWNAGQSELAVLCSSENGGVAVRMFHPDNPLSPRIIALHLEHTAAGSMMPSGISVSKNGAHLAVLVSGRSLDRPSGGDASWLYLYDARSLEPIAPPCELPGLASPDDDPLEFDDRGAIWVNTREPSAGFGHVTRIAPLEGQLRFTRTDAYTGVTGRMWTAPAPNGARLATGLNRRVSIMPGEYAIEFAAPVTLLNWDTAGLFVGEGGRLHRVDPETGEITASLQFQSGAVVDAIPVRRSPRPDKSPISPATGPPASSLNATMPTSLTFHAEAVGREVQSLVLPPGPTPGTTWTIDYDPASMPWLHVYPREGVLPARIVLGVDPDYRAGTAQIVSGFLAIHRGAGPAFAPGKSRAVEIRITPDRQSMKRILWITADDVHSAPLRSQTNPRHWNALMELLAAPPFSFSHAELRGAVTGPLDAYALVVITSKAAAAGLVTRSALLGYVAGGGSLLVLGEYSGNAAETPDAGWLTPAGIRISPATRLDGTYAPTTDHELARNWDAFSIASGMAFRTDSPDAVVVPGPQGTEYVVLSASSHGLGRIACLASATPLQDTALAGESARRFAADLFSWLAGARYEISDHDGDGLSDDTEDRNANGAVDPGETDHLNRDSDGDFIPDSLEDLNRNGWMDEGELNPANADSDSDGIQDGADAEPLPKAGAPYLAALKTLNGDSAEGPSEGGTIVEITGRNFTANTRIWFGKNLSPRVRIVDATHVTAVTPPFDLPTGGAVKVRAVDVAGQQEDSLTFGFRYTPRSVARIVVRSIDVAVNGAGAIEGLLEVRVECPGVSLGNINFTLAAPGADGIEWISAGPSENASALKRNVSGTPVSPNAFSIMVSPGSQYQDLGDAARVRWALSRIPETGILTIQAESPRIRARNGVILPTSIIPVTIDLAQRGLISPPP